MKFIGIDPGIATTGWAVMEVDPKKKQKMQLVDFGTISTSKLLSKPERLAEIASDLNELLTRFQPEVVGIETLIFYNNAKTAMAVGEARGVLLLSLAQANISIYEFTPLQVKMSVTGYGKADKKQVQENVKRICGLERIPKPDDAADAIAIAICAIDNYRVNPSI